MIVSATPLWSLSGERLFGTLGARIDSGVWIAGALGASRTLGDPLGPEFELGLTDGSGRVLEVRATWVRSPRCRGCSAAGRSRRR